MAKKTIVNVQTGQAEEVDCRHFRNAEWVYMCIADSEEIPEGYFEFDPDTDIKPDPQGELLWAQGEIAVVKDMLEAISFDDPDVPGTADDWKAYGRALRAWKEGAPGFPDPAQRPVRPH